MVRKRSILGRAWESLGHFHLAFGIWEFLTSQISAVYIWGPLLTIWGLVAGWRQGVPTPYLLAACGLIFGSIQWAALQLLEIKDRYHERHEKLKIDYDRSVPSCREDVTFSDGTHSMCFRLKVENITRSRLGRCEGWLESVDKFPNIGPARLFWADMPTESMSVDLVNGVPRFLQICRITQTNQVLVATANEVWPFDSLESFHPGSYVFRVAFRAFSGLVESEWVFRNGGDM
jgi:hypothetical protein